MRIITEEKVARAYYQVKPFLSRWMQVLVRSAVARAKKRLYRSSWPIDRGVARPPDGWEGWPGQKEFALVLTHDVDTARGVERCADLMALEQELGFSSSFNFVVNDYHLPAELRQTLEGNGFEVGVHGLEHSRKMYESEMTFALHAAQINAYLKEWGAVGFRSPCMYHNYEWLHRLEILYDASSFDTDPFEPQSDGLRSIFPVSLAGKKEGRGYIELPYTLPQDFTLFILLRERTIDTWMEKLRWVAAQGGMALLITHPDYMCFSGAPRCDEYPVSQYLELLQHLKAQYAGSYWHALPRDVAAFWAKRAGKDAVDATVPRRVVEVEGTGEATGVVPSLFVEAGAGG